MNSEQTRRPQIEQWHGQHIRPGETTNVTLAIGESYSSLTVEIPIQIRRAAEDGPIVFVTAALHGDEINGTGAIRHLIQDSEFEITRGTLLLVPVLNLLAFDRHSRYLPDRRDLNRSFPGSASGSLAARMARTIFDEIACRCDFGIDLHTAAVRRTNFPNVRGDLGSKQVRSLAEAFGCEVIVDGKGPQGSFRREACNAGCPTIIMEGGEVWKVEPGIVETATRGIRNVLRHLNMFPGEQERPDYQIIIKRSKWIRADRGGFLQFHVSPGDLVEQDQPLASNNTLLGEEQTVITAPFDGVIIGMTTLPSVSPGEPVCNLGKLPRSPSLAKLRRSQRAREGLDEQVSHDLSTSVMVVDPSDPE